MCVVYVVQDATIRRWLLCWDVSSWGEVEEYSCYCSYQQSVESANPNLPTLTLMVSRQKDL